MMFVLTIFNANNTQHYLTQIVDSLSELEALMGRMKRLQEEREDEEASQEEMTTRFEKEKKESLFVVSGDTFHSFPHSGASLSLLFSCS
jgi:sestrin